MNSSRYRCTAGSGSFISPGPVLTNGARLQLQLLGAAEHLRHPDRPARELMRDLGRINGDLMKAQQQGQAPQARIG
jgi:hypothetical protein